MMLNEEDDGNASFPIAFILVDCSNAARDHAFLQVAVDGIKDTFSNCELNFYAYQSPDELVLTCLTILKSLKGKTNSPLQFIWASFYDFANLGEDSALAVLALHNALQQHTASQLRSIMIRGGEENDISFQWGVLLGSHSIIIHDLHSIANEKEWLVGSLEIENVEFAVCCDPFSHFKLPYNQTARIIGCMERSIAEPYLDNYSANLY